MYCLANICYVCFEKTTKLLSNINNPSSIHKDIIHIIGYLPFDLAWLKMKRIILICEACCLRLRETYQFLKMCHKNSAILKSGMDLLNSTPISNTDNEAELTVMLDLNVQQKHVNEVKCEIELVDDEIYIDEYESVIVETEDVFVNLEDTFVKEEYTWKREELDERNEYQVDNNSTEITDKESDSDKSVNSNAHITYSDCVGTGFACKPVHETNKEDLNTAAISYKPSTRGELVLNDTEQPEVVNNVTRIDVTSKKDVYVSEEESATPESTYKRPYKPSNYVSEGCVNEPELSDSSYCEPFSPSSNNNYFNSDDSFVERESAVKKNLILRTTKKRGNQEDMLNSYSRIIVNAIGNKFDKRTCCIYCKELVLKLPRHLVRNHKDEKDVREMCCLPARDSRRLFILARIRKEGNYYYNQESLESQQGNLIVKRRSNAAQDGYKYRPCPYCLGYYKYRFLYLHVKRCQATNRQRWNIENS